MRKTAPWMLLCIMVGVSIVAGCASGSATPSNGSSNAAAPSNSGGSPAAARGDRAAAPAANAAKGTAPKEAAKTDAKSPPPAAVNSRIGDVRISLFALSKGKNSNEYSGTYLMLVNRSWLAHKRSLDEPFAQVVQPGVKIVDDDVMEGLLKHLNDCGMNNMPGSGTIDVAALKRPQVEGVRYITVNRDGQSRTVERARVSKGGGLIGQFVDMELGVNQVWHASQTYMTETQKQDWRDAFQSYLELKKAQNAAEAAAAPKAEKPPPAKQDPPAGSK